MSSCRIESENPGRLRPRSAWRNVGLCLLVGVTGLAAAFAPVPPALAARQPQTAQPAQSDRQPAAGKEQHPQQPAQPQPAASPLAPARPILLSPLVRPESIPLPPVESPAAGSRQPAGEGQKAADVSSRPEQEEASLPAQEKGGRVASEGLGKPDPAAIGVSFESGALAGTHDLWAGMSRTRLQALIAALDLAALPAPLVELGRRLLLVAATPPPAGEGEDPLALLRARFDALARAGLSHEIVTLGSLRDPTLADGDILYHLVEAQLVEGAFADGCALGRAADARSHERRWLPILLFCAAHEADRAQLDLTLGLYDELFGEDALAILALRLADLRESGSSAISPPEPGSYAHVSDPVVTAVAATLVGESPPVAFVTRASGLTLAALLRHDRLEPDARIIAAMKGYEAHLLDAAGLAQILVAYPFPPGSRQGLLESPPPPLSAPLQLRLLTEARRMAAVVQWLAEASEGEELMGRIGHLSTSLAGDEFLHLAPLIALPLSALSPQPGGGDHLPAVLDTFIASNRLATARQWWNAAIASLPRPEEEIAGSRGLSEADLSEAEKSAEEGAASEGGCPADPAVTLRGLAFLLAPLEDGEAGEPEGLRVCLVSAVAALPAPRMGEMADGAAILLDALGRGELARRFTEQAIQALADKEESNGATRVLRPAPASLWAVLSKAVAHRRIGEGLLSALLLAERSEALAPRSAVIAALESLGFSEQAERMAVREWLHRLHQVETGADSLPADQP